MIARWQLVALGYGRHAIRHRIATGRLHRTCFRGVYAVGRPHLTRQGRWMAAVLCCGSDALLSHGSAAALWGVGIERPGPVEVAVRSAHPRRPPGVRVRRRASLRDGDVTSKERIRVTTPVQTLVDVAARHGLRTIELAVNEADRRDLIDPETLRGALDECRGRQGVARLREVLDRRTFTLTDSGLERLFLPLVRELGLPLPLTQLHLNGFKVDFFWPYLGLVVETDGLRYHRTPAQQARDLVRDQAHTVAGMTPLRFTREQVKFEPAYVRETLGRVAAMLGSQSASRPGRSGGPATPQL